MARKRRKGRSRKSIGRAGRWIAAGLSRLERSAHVRRCIPCKELLDQCAVADEEYVDRAKVEIQKHTKAVPVPDNVSCQYSGCVRHERVSKALGLAILRVAHGDKPWRDVRGVKVGTAPLKVTEEDHPEGFDMSRQDAVRRAAGGLPDSAGDIYVRMGPKVTMVHVWAAPTYTSRRSSLDEPAAIWDVMGQDHAALVKWVVAKYDEIKGLAEMDLQLEGE